VKFTNVTGGSSSRWSCISCGRNLLDSTTVTVSRVAGFASQTGCFCLLKIILSRLCELLMFSMNSTSNRRTN
jgi:hypothetical protein